MTYCSSLALKSLTNPIVLRPVASASDDDSGSATSYKPIPTTKTTKRVPSRLGVSAIQTTVANTAIPTQSMSNAIVIGKLRSHSDPQEPPIGTLAADDSISQEWDVIEMPANRWCANEPEEITLRELKHTWVGKNRMLSLLILESAAPRPFVRSGWEEEQQHDSFDRFIDSGQLPVR